MTRITIQLPHELLAAAQQRARDSGRAFADLLADAIRNELRASATWPYACDPLPTFRGNGVRSGVDLADRSALQELMDGR